MTDIKRSRRLRKKLYLDEFAVKGFEISATYERLNPAEMDQLMEKLIDFVESHDLCIGGGMGSKEMAYFVTSNLRFDSATQQNRLAFEEWFKGVTMLTDFSIGELVDANDLG
ncbi:Uncharacterised protein [BD1-7 clade bacterium]|uniref:DUF469 domain-containing protein n=1 Tax=BD1-7 clade bacterium TaxID=2029982 RepID=A0A5S9PAF8_9GAMM|nr:Uncharacterised protein [BD1-7 clade bacterium]CAA0101465.1 Uncharacterised protein [BD1-7 clade bacterium]